ncbi:MAG: septum formation initiator family protein [Alphaproteobacteria bacterium]|nr:septum formation initiator family protein [Alphaproteobacteria bacterium]
MNFLNDIKYWINWIKQSWLLMSFVILFFYLVYNIFCGDRSLQKYLYLKKEVQYAKEIASQYQQKKEDLNQEIKLLSPNSLDFDLLDERARDVLNLVGKGEFIILDE